MRGTTTGILMILISAQLLYTAKLFYSPVYFIIIAAIPAIAIVGIVKDKNILNISSTNITLLFLSTFLLITTILKSSNYSSLTNFLAGAIAFVFIRHTRNEYDSVFWEKLLRTSIKAGALILGIDSIWRVMHPQMPSADFNQHSADIKDDFYPYKFGSLMFADSNTTALAAMTLLFCSLAMLRKGRKISYLWPTLHAVIIASSFSRAAWLATAIAYIVLATSRTTKIFGLALSILALPILIPPILSDGSALSKLTILQIATTHISSASPSEMATGIGLDQSIKIFGIYTHSLPITLMVETGVIGFALFHIFILLTLRDSNGIAIWVWTPLLISSLSYFLYIGAPFIFIPLALLMNLFTNTLRAENG